MAATIIPLQAFLVQAVHIPVLDVRSEGEFAAGYLPDAYNLPLLDNDARRQVGTVYKEKGQAAAMALGYELVNPKRQVLVEAAAAVAPERQVLLYCWRGGLRSDRMAWLLAENGFTVQVLHGGYKTWRRYTQQLFAQPWQFRVLGGLTGSGKTEVLQALAEAGAQVLDLEALAHHRGSAFGGLGLAPQPTTEQYENRIAAHLHRLNPQQPVWVEDEGRTLGQCVVPPGLYEQYRLAPRMVLEASTEARVARLVAQYGDLPKLQLAHGVQMIRRKLGGLAADQALAALENNDLATVARICLTYYDKSYLRQEQGRSVEAHLHLDFLQMARAVGMLLDWAHSRREA